MIQSYKISQLNEDEIDFCLNLINFPPKFSSFDFGLAELKSYRPEAFKYRMDFIKSHLTPEGSGIHQSVCQKLEIK